MELVAIDNSRVLRLFLTRRLSGQMYMPELCRSYSERYHFVVSPQSFEDMTSDPVSFSHGLFASSAIDQFSIYEDGVTVSAKADTELLDAFLDDVIDWSKTKFGLDRVETQAVSKSYESHIVFRSKKNILRPLSAYHEVASVIATGFKKATGQVAAFEPAGFVVMAADLSPAAVLKPIHFSMVRRGEPGYYLSSAPMRTKDHLAVLSQLEAV
jgi:hypothetical protein